MSYCTYTDLVERFGVVEISQLTSQQGPCPAVFSAIADAEAQIDCYVAKRYALPLATPVPDAIKRCACELARYFLWDDKSTDHVRMRYEDAITLLQGIAAGTVLLSVAEISTNNPSVRTVRFSPGVNRWQRGSM